MVFKLDQFQNEMCKKKVSGKHHCINKLLIAMGYTLKPTASNIPPFPNSPTGSQNGLTAPPLNGFEQGRLISGDNSTQFANSEFAFNLHVDTDRLGGLPSTIRTCEFGLLRTYES